MVTSLMKELNNPENDIENPTVFTRELFEGCLSKNSLIDILFSGTLSNFLIEKIEIALKKLIQTSYPQPENDIAQNIILT